MEEISSQSLNLESKSLVHILPCKIIYNGKANVNSFFSSSIIKSNSLKTDDDSNEELQTFENAFRGRPLNGVKIDLNQNKLGLIIDQNVGQKNYEITSTIDSIYSWQLDEPKINPKTESFNRTITDYFNAADIIHSD